ncbi:WD repeat-containing protein 48 [Cyphellophora attinorum]|uniref:WD repeat-containing protein 48 n=1 Tax=Cyphellophora attinorum TaxID=1664694 RepID=A0A0N1NXZ1_9EURO|nr:WD repeat-containing protein 48 [Phialophora attinorum]KPI38944.1 WD repeat-containing protein 48 [Phialophora attinorum]
MAKKKRQRISYVLPLAATPGGHRLGVNGLAYDQDRSILYTAGRDGVRYLSQTGSGAYTLVNDIVLVKNNLGVVSASSDVTVKLWRPHSHGQDGAYTIGSHSDYVKCLTTPDKSANWVASGGLDHRICLWDLAGGGSTLDINLNKLDETVNKGSIYTLKAKGSMIASGGPEGVVRLWDIKSGKSITKFVGHTDNVRDLLISEDGDTILSASSDQTIKLGDKSGLVAKTDTRRAMEIEEGVSVAVCQEHDGIARLVPAGNSIWTATSSSSVNRWKDVDTELEIQTPPQSPRHERSNSALSHPDTPPDTPTTNGSSTPRIPHNAVLRLANTALHPGRKRTAHHANHSMTNVRKASEITADDLSLIVPIRGQPAETIEGQNGLIKHVMLNDRKRILTLDTAGEVVLWDLLKCVPIKSFGRRHLDEVVPEVNTTESVANWCAVDTKTGKITVMLEENYAFDAEVYADEIDITEKIDFREDQRINLGKWVLRNLFTTLLDEEIRRDEDYRKKAAEGRLKGTSGTSTPALRPNAPTSIAMPTGPTTPGPVTTPRANGTHAPRTPGLAIGAATPGRHLLQSDGVSTPGSAAFSPSTEAPLDKRLSRTSQPPGEGQIDYFSSAANTSDESSENKENTTVTSTEAPPSNPASPTEERKKPGLFGKKFQMGFQKKPPRLSTDVKSPGPTSAPVVEDKSDDAASSKSSEREEKIVEDNFLGTVQRIRHEYDEHLEQKSDEVLPPGITPSLPIETPVLKPPPHTLVIIQEDNPESGGLADQYRGEIANLGKEADILEKIAPMWLGELLLRNQIPYKDTVKVSFVLHPYEDVLPSIASPDGNARLNANRMLRAKKILAYVAERIEAPPPAPPTAAEDDSTDATPAPPSAEPMPEEPRLQPQEYLELYCQGIRVDPNMTLATLRVHLWRTGGDVVLYYKSNGKKKLRLPHPAEVPSKEESAEGTGVGGE